MRIWLVHVCTHATLSVATGDAEMYVGMRRAWKSPVW